MYVKRETLDRVAKDIAELVELASFRDIGAAGILARSLCQDLGINIGTLMGSLSTELMSDDEFMSILRGA